MPPDASCTTAGAVGTSALIPRCSFGRLTRNPDRGFAPPRGGFLAITAVHTPERAKPRDTALEDSMDYLLRADKVCGKATGSLGVRYFAAPQRASGSAPGPDALPKNAFIQIEN